MNKKTLIIGVSTVLLGASVLFPMTAAAYQGNPAVQGPNYSADRHRAMQKAFDNKDIAAWKALMPGKDRVSQVITEANFAKFAEAHALAQQGKTAEAAQIRQDLGLGNGNGAGSCGGTCNGSGQGFGPRANR